MFRITRSKSHKKGIVSKPKMPLKIRQQILKNQPDIRKAFKNIPLIKPTPPSRPNSIPMLYPGFLKITERNVNGRNDVNYKGLVKYMERIMSYDKRDMKLTKSESDNILSFNCPVFPRAFNDVCKITKWLKMWAEQGHHITTSLHSYLMKANSELQSPMDMVPEFLPRPSYTQEPFLPVVIHEIDLTKEDE